MSPSGAKFNNRKTAAAVTRLCQHDWHCLEVLEVHDDGAREEERRTARCVSRGLRRVAAAGNQMSLRREKRPCERAKGARGLAARMRVVKLGKA